MSETEQKENVKLENDNRSGFIYLIYNTIDSRKYCGQTILRPAKRWQIHLNALRHSYHDNPILQNFFNKYGEETLKFHIIASNIFGQNLLNYYEKFFVKFYDCYPNGFNCNEGGSEGCNPGKPIKIKNIFTNEIKEFNTITDCGNFLGIGQSGISRFKTKKDSVLVDKWTHPENTNFKIHEFVSPEGEIYKVFNVNEFAKEKKLHQGGLAKLIRETAYHSQGWKLLKNKDKFQPAREGLKFKLIHNSGQVYEANSFNRTVQELNLSEMRLRQLIKGYILEHKGWKVLSIDQSSIINTANITRRFQLIKNNKIKEFLTYTQCAKELGFNLTNDLKLIGKLVNGQILELYGWKLHEIANLTKT